MTVIDVHDTKSQFSKLVKCVAVGEVIIIAKAGKPVARLVPYEEPKRKPGAWKGKIWISPDFDKVDRAMEPLFYEESFEPFGSGLK